MKKPIVVMTGLLRPIARKLVEEHCDVRIWDKPGVIPRETLLEWLADAEGMIVPFARGIMVNDELLSRAPHLKVVSQAAVGYDNVDVAACTAHKVPVGNTPGVLIEATADLAFTLLLCAARRIAECSAIVRNGLWTTTTEIPFANDLHGKTLGIVGMGQIGSSVARRARAFGLKVIYHNRRPSANEDQLGAVYCTLDELLTQADFIVALTPLSAETRNMFGRDQFAKMKRTAYFVNAARGGIVDTQALYEALRDQVIAGAAIDVTEPEPIPVDHPLIKLPNILITPHIGTSTVETRDAMAMLAARNLFNGLAQKSLETCVNPEVNYK